MMRKREDSKFLEVHQRLGTNMAKLIAENHTQVRELAKFCQVSQVYIYTIINGGRSASLEVLLGVSEYFGIPLDELCYKEL